MSAPALLHSSLIFENPKAFKHLPNCGVYSIVYERRRPLQGHKPQSPVRCRQYEYSWGSAVPKQWRRLTKRRFVRRNRIQRNESFQYLSETQKYIHRLQTQPSADPPLRPMRRSSSNVLSKTFDLQRAKSRQTMYTVMYVGEIDGDLGSTCVSMPLRPSTSVQRTTAVSVRRCRSQAQARASVPKIAESHAIQTDGAEKPDAIAAWANSRRSSDSSEDILQPVFVTQDSACSPFELYLKEGLAKGRPKKGKRIRM